MIEYEINQVIEKNKVLESDNRILKEKVKNLRKDIQLLKKLYEEEKSLNVKLSVKETRQESFDFNE